MMRILLLNWHFVFSDVPVLWSIFKSAGMVHSLNLEWDHFQISVNLWNILKISLWLVVIRVSIICTIIEVKFWTTAFTEWVLSSCYCKVNERKLLSPSFFSLTSRKPSSWDNLLYGLLPLTGVLTLLKYPYPRDIEEPTTYEKVRVHAEWGKNRKSSIENSMDHSVSENCLKSVLETYKIFFLGGVSGGGISIEFCGLIVYVMVVLSTTFVSN